MSLFADLFREINEAEVLDRSIAHIRVTAHALPGSIVTTPITPERLRALGRLDALPDGTVVGSAESERLLEIIVHPADWQELLLDPALREHAALRWAGVVSSVWGIPVHRWDVLGDEPKP